MTIAEIGGYVGVAILAGRGAIWIDTWLRARNKVDQKTIDAIDERLKACERKVTEIADLLRAHMETLKRIGDDCSTEISRINESIGKMELHALEVKTRVTIMWDLASEDRRHFARRESDSEPRRRGNGEGGA